MFFFYIKEIEVCYEKLIKLIYKRGIIYIQITYKYTPLLFIYEHNPFSLINFINFLSLFNSLFFLILFKVFFY